MKFGKFEITSWDFGSFRLDGGSMFGSVPKNIWSKRIQADDQNCITLATRSLLIRDGERLILIDSGMGYKWNEKEKLIYAINPKTEKAPFRVEEVTDLILTHLHFDHAGGATHFNQSKLELTYPRAKIYLQKSNLQNAQNPNVKERASYLEENYKPLIDGNLVLLEGKTECIPGIWTHKVDGHTSGQQWIEIKNGDSSLVFPTDLIPTSHHLPVPFHMGYDICAATLLKEKQLFLEDAVKKAWIVAFEHDPKIQAGTVRIGDKGHFELEKEVRF